MNITLQKIEQMRRDGFHFEFGELFDQTFNNYKKIALMQGLVLLVVLMGFTILVGSVTGLAIGVGQITEFFTDMQVNGMGPTTIVINLLVGVVGAGLAAPFTAGLLKMAHLAEENKEFGFSTAFDYYNSRHFTNLFLTGVYIALFTSGVAALVNILNESYAFLKIGLGIASFTLNIVIAVLTIFATPLVIFGNMNAIDAIKSSFAIGWSKFWMILGLGIVIVIIACLGIFGFCLGIFFTLPLIYSMEYIVYRSAFGIKEENEIDEIGSEG